MKTPEHSNGGEKKKKGGGVGKGRGRVFLCGDFLRHQVRCKKLKRILGLQNRQIVDNNRQSVRHFVGFIHTS